MEQLSSLENFLVYSRYIEGCEIGCRQYISPLRREGVASFCVDFDRGLWYDFGLGRGGNLVQFIMEYEGIGYRDAMNIILRVVLGIGGSDNRGRVEEIYKVEKEKKVKGYKLPDIGDLRRVGLGTWRDEFRERGIDLGLLGLEGKVYCIEYCNKVWLCIEYGGRDYKLIRRLEGGGKEILTKGSSNFIYIGGKGGLMICEGELDALSLGTLFRKEGIELGVMGIPGAGTFKEGWVGGMDDRSKVYVLLDADRAGSLGSKRIADIYMRVAYKKVHILNWEEIYGVDQLKQGYDVGDMVANDSERVKFIEYIHKLLGV